MNPEEVVACFELGRLYRNENKLVESEASFEKAVMSDHQNGDAYLELGWIYREQGKFSQAQDAFMKALETSSASGNFRYFVYSALSALYLEMGKPKLAEEYALKARMGSIGCYSSVTVDNYRKLKAILGKRGIRLVCVQYPMRSIAPLKNIFEGDEGDIIFVDNEQIFKDAVKKEGTIVYFRDMFAGDFGHCTEKGNRLLAGNIAKEILKELFGHYAKR
jgi:tetratricopeptide (TPR) repeat protein